MDRNEKRPSERKVALGCDSPTVGEKITIGYLNYNSILHNMQYIAVKELSLEPPSGVGK